MGAEGGASLGARALRPRASVFLSVLGKALLFSELPQFSLEQMMESGASGKAVSIDSLRFIILYGRLLVLDIHVCVTVITVLGLERWLCS